MGSAAGDGDWWVRARDGHGIGDGIGIGIGIGWWGTGGEEGES